VALGEGVSFEYFIFAETFRVEVCSGFDYKAVSRVLLAHGWPNVYFANLGLFTMATAHRASQSR